MGGGPSPAWLLIFLTIKHLFVAARRLRIDLFLVVKERTFCPVVRWQVVSPCAPGTGGRGISCEHAGSAECQVPPRGTQSESALCRETLGIRA